MPPPLPSSPPPLPPSASWVLEYRRGGSTPMPRRRDRGALLCSAVILFVIGFAIAGAMVDWLVQSWPDFGTALITVPVGLVAAAFFLIATTAAKLALTADGDVESAPPPRK